MGIGRSLLQHFEDWAQQRDCLLVGLVTSHTAAFYEHLGYELKAMYLKKHATWLRVERVTLDPDP